MLFYKAGKAFAFTGLVFFFIGYCISIVQAQPAANENENAPKYLRFGLAMHGLPKYEATSTHLDYTNPQAEKGGHLKQSAIGTFDTLNPYSLKGTAAQGLNLVYCRLMTRVWDEPFTLYPSVAGSYETNEERSFITFHLNPDARFQDGTPITADDILFSFETLREKGRPNMRQVYSIVDRAAILSPASIAFTFNDGHDRETALIIAMMPVLSKSWWADRDFDSTVLDVPNTCGPYTIDRVDPGRSISYLRNTNYWAANQFPNIGLYNFDRITFDYYRDQTVALESFLAGDLDLYREGDIGRWSSVYTSPLVQSGQIIKSEFLHGRPERAKGFIFNTRREPFNDINVRQALSLLLDKDWLITNFFYNAYQKSHSYFPNSEFDILSESINAQPAPVFRSQLRDANALLGEAGWAVQNGILQKDGKPFEFELLLSDPQDEKLALHFQRNLERLGIRMTIRVLDSAAFIGRLNEYDYDMVSYFWQSSLSPGTEQILYWGCDAAIQKGRWNFPGICDETIDQLAASVPATEDRESLVRTMQNLDKALIDGFYMIPLFYSGKDYIAHQRTINYTDYTPIYGPVLESWWMEGN